MKTRDIKTIDVTTKTWFDKVNGNTYFAQVITVNFGRKDEKRLINRFQYGYSSYEHFAKKFVMESLNLKTDLTDWNVCGSRNARIIFRHTLQRDCKKRELLHIGEE